MDHPYLPHNYDKDSVVYTGTHDNNTVLGWFENQASKHEIDNVENYLKKTVSTKSICWDLIHLAFFSSAYLVIVPIQDILSLGDKARMNTPASTLGNWRWRLQQKMLNSKITHKLKLMTLNSGRA